MRADAEFDIIVYGATGFTGRLVAEHLAGLYGADGPIRWAMAGRSPEKLAAVREEIGAPPQTPLVVADAEDPASLKAMVERTRAVVSTVGPYQLYDHGLVAACAAAGTDYLDLCGETPWMRRMIDAHEATARKTGARIIFSAGFDSIPFELGVFFLEETARARFGAPAPRVKGRVRAMRGGMSGGTAASMKVTMASARDPAILALLLDPFSLTPGFKGPEQPRGTKAEYDADIDAWVAPFVMAAINTRNVHRSNALLGHAYGKDLVYDEMVVVGPGSAGEEKAKAMAKAGFGMGEDGPKPGEGPSRAERESGFSDLLFVGLAADGRQVRVSVTTDKDPGYGATSKMIAEAAVCLVKDAPGVPGGMWTPVAAMGHKLLDRLQANAGMTVKVEEA